MTTKKLNKLIKLSLLSAIAFLIMFVELPLPPFPTYLKFDFSDLPALIGAFAFGPLAGVAIELIKNVIHGLLATSSGWIGELANFLVGSTLVITAGSIYKYHKSKKMAIISLVCGTIVMSICAAIFNLYVLLPLYLKSGDFTSIIIYSIIPFNLVKGTIVSVITILIYKSISPLLHK